MSRRAPCSRLYRKKIRRFYGWLSLKISTAALWQSVWEQAAELRVCACIERLTTCDWPGRSSRKSVGKEKTMSNRLDPQESRLLQMLYLYIQALDAGDLETVAHIMSE